MDVYGIIATKRDGKKLRREEIDFLISDFTSGKIPDYQMSAVLMAVCINGMDEEETRFLTESMLHSGQVLDLSFIDAPKIDKHSTGGVGDKVSLILAPLLASCGVVVPMISGRGLGHTGGTLDKLESIPGFKTSFSLEEFKEALKRIGVAIIAQTQKIAPADKKIYALRDVTATVESIPLIVASIMSKKLASGCDGIVFDVKVGNGAFMRKLDDAERLAKTLNSVAKRMGRKAGAVFTSMDEPLGFAVGNALEVVECIECLKGESPRDLWEVTEALGVQMLLMGGVSSDKEAARKMLRGRIASGEALEKFEEMVENQGGDSRAIDDYSRLPRAKLVLQVKAERDGFLKAVDTLRVGQLWIELGGGRELISDQIDPAVGFIFEKKIGDRVERGEVIASVHASDRSAGEKVASDFEETYILSHRKVKPLKKVIGFLN
ncbi:MAG: thymidine phosphorylase [Candidatus Zixiibacteriota bacterium]